MSDQDAPHVQSDHINALFIALNAFADGGGDGSMGSAASADGGSGALLLADLPDALEDMSALVGNAKAQEQ